MSDELRVEDMTADDAETVLRIYGEGIATGIATFDTAVPDWQREHDGRDGGRDRGVDALEHEPDPPRDPQIPLLSCWANGTIEFEVRSSGSPGNNLGFTLQALSPAPSAVEAFVRRLVFETSGPFVLQE